MAQIPASEIKITTVHLVDCSVCREAVEPDAVNALGGGFRTREEAMAAKKNHLEEHERGEWG